MPSENRSMSMKNRIRTAASQINFKMTPARRAALKKAQEASAKARAAGANAFAKVGGNTKLLRAKMAAKRIQNKAKGAAARVKGKVSKAVSSAKNSAQTSFNQAGGNTKLLRAKISTQAKGRKAKNKINRTIRAAKTRIDAASANIKMPRYDGPAGGKPKNSILTKAKAGVAKLTGGTAGLNAGPSSRRRGSGAGAQLSSGTSGPKSRSKVLGTAAAPSKSSPTSRPKVLGKAAAPSKSGPSTRGKSTGAQARINNEANKLMARGAKPESAKRTAKQKEKLGRKKR